MSKVTVALIATIAAFSFGTAYAAGDKAGVTPDTPGPSATTGATGATSDPMKGTEAMKKIMTKEEAMKLGGLTEAQFMAADTNGDGKLDENEQKAANVLMKPTSK